MLSASSIAHALCYSRKTCADAFIVQFAGEVICCYYSDEIEIRKPYRLFSLTKSIFAVLGSIVCGLSWIDWDAYVSSFITEWQNDDLKNKIKIRELLNMTSGLASGAQVIYNDATRDKANAAICTKLLAKPGSVFTYGPSGFEVFSELLNRISFTKGKTVFEILTEKILLPTNIQDSKWIFDSKNHLMFSSGCVMKADDVLNFSNFILNLFLCGSNIHNALLIATDINPNYGMGFWLNKNSIHKLTNIPSYTTNSAVNIERLIADTHTNWNSVCISTKAPNDLIAMVGSYGQRVYIIPSIEAIIIRLANPPELILSKRIERKIHQMAFTDTELLDCLFI